MLAPGAATTLLGAEWLVDPAALGKKQHKTGLFSVDTTSLQL